MKAREFLAQKVGEESLRLRNLIKDPLTLDEVRRLAIQVGDARQLVAPKRRAEADGLGGDKLLAWLAADGARLRRPIIVAGKRVTLGFTAVTRDELDSALR